MQVTRILIADSDLQAFDRLGADLTARGCEVFVAVNAEDLTVAAAVHAPEAVVLDPALFDGDGAAAAKSLLANYPALLVALIAEDDGAPAAPGFEVLRKPFTAAELIQALDRAAEVRRLRDENRVLRTDSEERDGPEDLAIRSPQMVDALRQAATAADTSEPVVLCGPPGTEKDIVALYIHRCSARARGPFVRFHCGRGPVGLEEAQLFGRGSGERQAGRLAVADGGTLFLDHIDELSPPCQAKLLRFVDEGQFLPAGAPPVRADVRIVCSIGRDLGACGDGERVREDLLHRLGAFSITVPPLSARPADVLPLARRFLRRFAIETSKDLRGISPAAERLIVEYEWPGNVAELRDCIRTAVTAARGCIVLPEDLLGGPCRHEAGSGITGPTLEDAQRQLIVRTLEEMNGDPAATAQRLRVPLAVLAAKLKRYREEGLIAPATTPAGRRD